jgi:hypothetical protein
MKKILLSAAAVGLLFAACKKDGDKNIVITDPVVTDTAPQSYFAVKKDTFLTPMGVTYEKGELEFADQDVTTLWSDRFTGTLNDAIIHLDTLIAGNTYTYLDEKDAAFDKKKNFAGGQLWAKQQWENGAPAYEANIDEDPSQIRGMTAGTVSVQKTDTTYTIIYDLKFDTIAVKGRYIGGLKLITYAN